MSNLQNDILIENLQDRMSNLLPNLTPDEISFFERGLSEDLEWAQYYVGELERKYPRYTDDGLIDVTRGDEVG